MKNLGPNGSLLEDHIVKVMQTVIKGQQSERLIFLSRTLWTYIVWFTRL